MMLTAKPSVRCTLGKLMPPMTGLLRWFKGYEDCLTKVFLREIELWRASGVGEQGRENR
jgi:hypothetical protein